MQRGKKRAGISLVGCAEYFSRYVAKAGHPNEALYFF